YAENVKRPIGGFGLAMLLALSLTLSLSLAEEQTSPARFQTSANVVLVNATVVDKHDRVVRGIGRDSFRLVENKSEQTLTYLGEEAPPLSLVVVVGTSGSMDSNFVAARRALGQVLRTSNREDEFSLITFAEHPHVALGWTANEAEIQNQVLLSRPGGCTT